MASIKPNDPELARRYFADALSYTTGPAELSKAMHDGSVRIVDVRARKDFLREHIPGSVNLPEQDWSTERGLARDRVNVVLCYSSVCHLAARAAVELAGRGYPVMELSGGFEGWKSHGLPTEAGDVADEEAIDRTRAFLEETRRAAREEQAHPPAKPTATGEAPAQEKADAAPKDAAPKDAAPKDAAPKDAAPKDAAPKEEEPPEKAGGDEEDETARSTGGGGP